MGKFSNPREKQPVKVSSAPKEEKPSIGAQKAATGQPVSGKNRKIILISICSVAVVLLISTIISIWYFFGWPTDDGLILNNVMVGGINLGGMTKEEAATALHEATDNTFTQMDMVIELPDITMTLSPADTGAKLDVDAIVEEAHAYGRLGNYKEREEAKEASLVTTHHIPLLNYLNLDLDYIKSELDAYGAGFNSVYVPSSVEFDIEAPILNAADSKFNPSAPCQVMTLTIGTPGRNVDIEALYNAVLDAYAFNKFLVTAEMTEEERIPDPINVEALYEAYRVEPSNAQLDMKTYEVTPEVYGYDFDLEKALEQMEQAQYGDVVKVSFRYLLPEVYAEELSNLLFRDVLGAYETAHSGDARRTTNLRLACAAIDGLVLEAGDVFDFNTVVGERTAAKGYQYADAYSSGETVKTLGGGICQISSTLYYCTLLADLEILERSPHSYVSSYMPVMGTDATVSWGGPHFSFKNSTNYPIRIEAKEEDGYVKIQLIGTDEKDYYIKMEHEIIGRQTSDTVYKEIPADNNPEGYKDGEVVTTAYTGYTVKTYKLKYSKETDELIVREYDRTSKYKKRDKVVIKLVQPTVTEPAPETPAPDSGTESGGSTGGESGGSSGTESSGGSGGGGSSGGESGGSSITAPDDNIAG